VRNLAELNAGKPHGEVPGTDWPPNETPNVIPH